MSAVVVESSPIDVRAVEAGKDHHERLAGALAVRVEALLEATTRSGLPDAMLAEHRDLVEAIRQATTPVRAVANAQALRAVFESHLDKEDDQILPLLAESSEVSLAAIVDDMQRLLGSPVHSEYAEAAAECGCGGECGCGHQHPTDLDSPSQHGAR